MIGQIKNVVLDEVASRATCVKLFSGDYPCTCEESDTGVCLIALDLPSMTSRCLATGVVNHWRIYDVAGRCLCQGRDEDMMALITILAYPGRQRRDR